MIEHGITRARSSSSASAEGLPFLGASTILNGLTALQKTTDLFEDRFVLHGAQHHLSGSDYSAWFKDAVSIQLLIYELDFCYEQALVVDPTQEAPLWRLLADLLSHAPCSNRDLLLANLHDLKAYAVTEARIHAFDLIDPKEFDNIVRLKCADVRIARSSGWLYAGFVLNKSLLRYWEMYDEAWELIEDLVDLGEDGLDWNFNFWLYRYMADAAGECGAAGVAPVLARRLRSLVDAYSDLSADMRSSLGISFRRTLDAGNWAFRNQWRPQAMSEKRKMTTYKRLAATDSGQPHAHHCLVSKNRRGEAELAERICSGI
jgi:hypothetical protein